MKLGHLVKRELIFTSSASGGKFPYSSSSHQELVAMATQLKHTKDAALLQVGTCSSMLQNYK